MFVKRAIREGESIRDDVPKDDDVVMEMVDFATLVEDWVAATHHELSCIDYALATHFGEMWEVPETKINREAFGKLLERRLRNLRDMLEVAL